MDIPIPAKAWYWIVVASLSAVRQSTQSGQSRFLEETLARQLRRGDWLTFYSAVTDSHSRTKCQMFTGIGRVEDEKPEPLITDEGYVWFHRKVRFLPCQPVPIQSLIPWLSFIRDPRHWGLPFKNGQFEISSEDFLKIAHALGIDWENLECRMKDY
jgi:hypothetical protein